MKPLLFACFALCVGQVALAQSVPVMKVGQCPTGTYASGGSCVPTGDNQVYYNGGGQCPQGWTKSKNYCVQY